MAEFPDQIELKLELDAPDDIESLRSEAARSLGVSSIELPELVLKKRSLDARRGRIHFHYLLEQGIPAELGELGLPHPKQCEGERRVVVVGDGPAGLFCAYQLARAGVPCLVVDRGRAVQPRRRDLKLLNARGGVDADSNYCFGEGGAGTYSDGKLYTRSHKRGPVRDVIEVLALHGAPEAILTESRPHIGSNLLPQIISAMRQRLEECGVEFRFSCRLEGIEISGKGSERHVTGVRLRNLNADEIDSGTLDDETTYDEAATQVVLATGHSARDIFRLAADLGLTMEAKGFALGVRIEHPQELINEIQFGRHAKHPKLGAASYKVATQVGGRGVFSFCMCPGGWIVPAMTDAEHLVVNGMSLSKRDSPFANSGFVVGIEPGDLTQAGIKGPLAGVKVQMLAERAAQVAGGGKNRAPAIRVSDFLAGRISSTLPDTSYLPGLTSSDMTGVLDETGLPLAQKMKEALARFGTQMRGYCSEDAILVGVESRTSAPVRLVRDSVTLQTPDVRGLYLCGEGPGYAGGIVSAAVDGLRVADCICAVLAGDMRRVASVHS